LHEETKLSRLNDVSASEWKCDRIELLTTGVAPSKLTGAADSGPFVGTSQHKHVPARIEGIAGSE